MADGLASWLQYCSDLEREPSGELHSEGMEKQENRPFLLGNLVNFFFSLWWKAGTSFHLSPALFLSLERQRHTLNVCQERDCCGSLKNGRQVHLLVFECECLREPQGVLGMRLVWAGPQESSLLHQGEENICFLLPFKWNSACPPPCTCSSLQLRLLQTFNHPGKRQDPCH